MAAAARSTSPTHATPPSATPPGATPPESNVSRAASVRFAGERTDSAPPLVGAPVPKYKFEEKLEEADSLLLNATNIGAKEKARAAYQKASEYLSEVEIPAYLNSLTLARCQIGIALTYPYRNPDRNSYTNMGESSNKNVYESRDSWNDLDKREKVVIYQGLIQNYKNLLALILISDKALRADLQNKKKECEAILESLKKEASSTPPSSVSPAPESTAAASSSAPAASVATPLAPPPAAPSARKRTAAAKSSAAVAGSSAASPPPPESTAAEKAPDSATAKPAAKPASRKVTPEPVGGSSTIRTIFGLVIITIAASVLGFAGVVIYKRYFVKK